ncbi:MAG: biotin transporter BioY [Limnochordia bacterium]|jgi:biotin transport system substrate-specific component|nr:biotin transporter BioY [Bacillota bacterium]
MKSPLSPRKMLLISLMAVVTAALSFVRLPLPFSPVPVTGQTIGVMLSGALLGGAPGALSQGIYLLLGLVGLPVFAGGAGALFGPTGGYLWGFVLGAYIIGRLWEGNPEASFRRSLLFMTAGLVVVYGLGLVQLSMVAGFSLRQGLVAGVLPFLPGEALKVVGATILARRIKRVGLG